jgi:hypothetical protein
MIETLVVVEPPTTKDPPAGGKPPRIARLEPALADLLAHAAAAHIIRSDVNANELLRAIAHLCAPGPEEAEFSHRMVELLLDGVRVIPAVEGSCPPHSPG